MPSLEVRTVSVIYNATTLMEGVRELEDCKIIELYFNRDERAITETSLKYGAYCTKIATNILADIFDAEECVNDAYIKAWDSIPPTVPTLLKSFLGRITRNIAIDRYNSKNADKRGGRIAESLDELSECIGTYDTESDINSHELYEIINLFLSREKELSRRVFVRRYFYGDSIADIAKKHRIGESRVKTMLFRARQKLAFILSQEGIGI